jgi:hypothetical protein
MARVQFIEHKGARILHIDFSGLDPRGLEEAIAEARAMIDHQPPDSLFTLTDTSNGRFDDAAVKKLKEYTQHNKPFVRTAAVVGITGIKKIILSGVRLFTGRDFALFDDVPSAKDWLASRAAEQSKS